MYVMIIFFVGGTILLRVAAMFAREKLPSGELVQLGQGACRVKVTRGKGRRVAGVAVGFEAPGGWRFNLRREGWFDRFAKGMGLAQEFQTHSESFDRPIYIECDDPVLHQQLGRHKELREQITALFRNLYVRRLEWAEGALWISVDPGYVDRDRDDEQIGVDVARPLVATVAALREQMASPSVSDETARDPTRITRKNFGFAIFGLVVCAGIAVAWQFFHQDHQVVVDRIFVIALTTAVAIVLALLVVLVMSLGGTSRAQRVLLDILIAGAPAAWLAASGGVMYLNEALDESASRRVPVPVDRAWMTTSRKGRHDWYAEMRWPDARGKRPIDLRGNEYDLVQSQACVDVLWRAGWSGDGWIERYQSHQGGGCAEEVER